MRKAFRRGLGSQGGGAMAGGSINFMITASNSNFRVWVLSR